MSIKGGVNKGRSEKGAAKINLQGKDAISEGRGCGTRAKGSFEGKKDGRNSGKGGGGRLGERRSKFFWERANQMPAMRGGARGGNGGLKKWRNR